MFGQGSGYGHFFRRMTIFTFAKPFSFSMIRGIGHQ